LRVGQDVNRVVTPGCQVAAEAPALATAGHARTGCR
jgi:hypothetical protein